VYGTFGVHPHDARFFNTRVESRLIDLMRHPKALAIGEIGLDFHYDNSPRQAQREAFDRQVALAVELGKPVIVHSREAESDTFSVLERYFEPGRLGAGVMHCFTGSVAMAQSCINVGFDLSFGGMLTFRKMTWLREIAQLAPRESIMLETDCPYLAPQPMRGKRNEPAYVRLVAEELARLWGVTLSELAQTTTSNFLRLFGLEPDLEGPEKRNG
jgi:TatD DNase family protein